MQVPTTKSRVREFLRSHPDILTLTGSGALNPLVEEFGDVTNRKNLSKIKNNLIKEMNAGELPVKKVTTKTPTEKPTETATEKTTKMTAFTKDEIEKLKELVKPGKQLNYEIIYKIRSWNDTAPRSVRLSKRLLDQAKKKAVSQKLTLQEFINLAIYNEVNQ